MYMLLTILKWTLIFSVKILILFARIKFSIHISVSVCSKYVEFPNTAVCWWCSNKFHIKQRPIHLYQFFDNILHPRLIRLPSPDLLERWLRERVNEKGCIFQCRNIYMICKSISSTQTSSSQTFRNINQSNYSIHPEYYNIQPRIGIFLNGEFLPRMRPFPQNMSEPGRRK